MSNSVFDVNGKVDCEAGYLLGQRCDSRRSVSTVGNHRAEDSLPIDAKCRPALSYKTVFVAQEDETTHKQILQVLESWNIPARFYSTAHSLLEANVGMESGCLITGLHLTDMNGIELMTRLKHQSSILPVMVLSRQVDVSMAVKAMQAGATTVLELPCKEADLSSAILQTLAVDRKYREARLEAVEVRARLDGLNSVDQSLVDLILCGTVNRVIAERIGVSVRTVENRRSQLYEKLGASCLADFVKRIVRANQQCC